MTILKGSSVLWLLFALSSLATKSSSSKVIKVDPSGKGDFKTIQAAVDSVPTNNNQEIVISIEPGTYREKVTVPVDKPFVTMSGSSSGSTVITWSSGRNLVYSATLTVLAPNFVGKSLTIENTFGPSAQAAALRVSGDKTAFYACRMLSFQDTLLDDRGRHYYKDCYIEGGTDFICGSGFSLFDNCHLHSTSAQAGVITAHMRTSAAENTGFFFVNCKITGAGTTLLGRPWGPYARVVFAKTNMSKEIVPEGWEDWNNPDNQRTTYFAEFENPGPGGNGPQRVKWSHQLSSDEAAPFMTQSLINGQDWIKPPSS